MPIVFVSGGSSPSEVGPCGVPYLVMVTAFGSDELATPSSMSSVGCNSHFIQFKDLSRSILKKIIWLNIMEADFCDSRTLISASRHGAETA